MSLPTNGMIIIEAFVATTVLYLSAGILNNNVREENRISKRIHRLSSAESSLIIMMIIFSLRLLLESFSNYYIFEDFYLFRYLSEDVFLFAIMTTIYLPLHAIFLKKFENYKLSDDENAIQGEQFRSVYKKFIILSWIVGAIFLSIRLLQIPMENPDVFNLGFVWAIFVTGFAISITIIVNKTRSIETRIPNIVLKQAMYTGGFISFGIWSIQLVIVELYLRRLFHITLYIQNISSLILVVNVVYIIVFFITLKKIFEPLATERSKLKVQKAFEIYEKKYGEEIKGVGNHVILDVQDLTTYFYTEEGIVKAVEGVSFQ
ncbi:MAG: hypothetical protein ACW98D_21735, partial [Promethearchaeota archaeon]